MYYALYRKYRPLSFDDVLGQDAVTVTLRRQVASGQISHAYLFTGTRGTGKTTCAKILARAINCLSPKDGNPCNECAVCKGLLDGSIYDVEEIDAASNNGVEDVRRIREEVVYAPTAAKYRVYIIDEVHMLSQGAFNALLKTLEEPPAHAVFILATTESHKVPATILSRCQRFDFLRLPKQTLIGQFRSVLQREGKTMDERSLELVAEMADGSSRDGLSILDKVIDLRDFEQVEQVLGVIPKKQIRALLRAVAAQDAQTAYQAVETAYNASADLARLCTGMLEVFKQIMIVQSASDAARLLELGEEDEAELRELAALFPTERVLYSMKRLQETVALLPRSQDKRADTEVCMLRLSHPEFEPDLSALTARIATLEKAVRDLTEKGVPVSAPAPKPEPKSEPKPEPNAVQPPVFDDPFANPNVGAAGKYRIPAEQADPVPKKAPKFEPKPVASAPRTPAASSDHAFEEGWQPMTAWQDVAHTVGRSDRMLGFLMKSLTAVYRDRVILVPAEDAQDYRALRDPEALALIQDALRENRKEGYTVRIENCAPDKYVHHATLNQMKKENLFDFGDDDIPEYDE